MPRNQQENYPTFLMIFQFCSVWVCTKMQEKVSKSWNMDKSGLGKYVTINFGHFLLSYNPFWQSCNFLDTIGQSRSVCKCGINQATDTHSKTNIFMAQAMRRLRYCNFLLSTYLDKMAPKSDLWTCPKTKIKQTDKRYHCEAYSNQMI